MPNTTDNSYDIFVGFRRECLTVIVPVPRKETLWLVLQNSAQQLLRDRLVGDSREYGFSVWDIVRYAEKHGFTAGPLKYRMFVPICAASYEDTNRVGHMVGVEIELPAHDDVVEAINKSKPIAGIDKDLMCAADYRMIYHNCTPHPNGWSGGLRDLYREMGRKAFAIFSLYRELGLARLPMCPFGDLVENLLIFAIDLTDHGISQWFVCDLVAESFAECVRQYAVDYDEIRKCCYLAADKPWPDEDEDL